LTVASEEQVLPPSPVSPQEGYWRQICSEDCDRTLGKFISSASVCLGQAQHVTGPVLDSILRQPLLNRVGRGVTESSIYSEYTEKLHDIVLVRTFSFLLV
jgi:hypothetical protein